MRWLVARNVEITRAEKVLFPRDRLTKADLVAYYRSVAPLMLPHLRNRPLVMFRYPDGIDGKAWVHKEVPDYFPAWIHRVTVPKSDGKVTHVVCDDASTLAYLANQACITPHVWLSRVDRLDHPDRLIFDLDPPGISFAPVRRAAHIVGELLSELGLPSNLLTTGSRGLHVIVRLDRRADFDTVRDFARSVAALLAERYPRDLTIEARKAKRGKRLYLDVARNGYAQTTVAPFAVRALPGAPVAAPIEWSQLDDPGLTARTYSVANPASAWKSAPRPRSLTPAHRSLRRLLP